MMGPNLTQLFAERHATAKDGSSQAEVLAFALQQKCARDTLRALFDRHGKALIEALEKLTSYTLACEGLLNASPAKQVVDSQSLLAQLEKEAQR